MPLESLEYTGVDISTLTEGTVINVVNGHEICCKYIPCQKTNSHNGGGKVNKTRKKKVNIAPLFVEHADTEQLAYNLNAFKAGDLVEITLKLHGTSGRTGLLPVLKGYKKTLIDRFLRRDGKPIYDWDYIDGTRRVVLENYDGGYYGDNSFRKQHGDVFRGKLNKGEEVFYEIVGFTDSGAPIMGTVDNKKTQDKDFINKYGKTTTFSYGCEPPNSELYVYRMTMTNEDGHIVEYSPDYMRYRCEQMGVKTVPVLWKGYIPPVFSTDENGQLKEYVLETPGEYIKNIAEQFYDGEDPIGKTHIREGVVVRIINRPKFAAFKHKNFSFKLLSGIITQQLNDTEINNLSEDILSEM